MLIRHYASSAEARGRKAYGSQPVVCGLGNFKACRIEVLLQVLDRRGSGNRQNYLGPLKQPRQSDLQGACLEILSDLLQGVMRLLCLAERSPRKKRDATLLAVVDNEVGLAVGK